MPVPNAALADALATAGVPAITTSKCALFRVVVGGRPLWGVIEPDPKGGTAWAVWLPAGAFGNPEEQECQEPTMAEAVAWPARRLGAP